MALELGNTRQQRGLLGSAGVLTGLTIGVILAVTQTITVVSACLAAGLVILGIALIDPKLGTELLEKARGLRSHDS